MGMALAQEQVTLDLPKGDNWLAFQLKPAHSLNDIFEGVPKGSYLKLLRDNKKEIYRVGIYGFTKSPKNPLLGGEGFVLHLSKPAKIKVNGRPFNETPPVRLNKKDNWVGVPYCLPSSRHKLSESYQARDLLDEIREANILCDSILKPNPRSKSAEWYSYDKRFKPYKKKSDINKNFVLSSGEAYIIKCGSRMLSYDFTPKCGGIQEQPPEENPENEEPPQLPEDRIVLSACTEINKSGYYVLEDSLEWTKDYCISIKDTNNVTLNCLNHHLARSRYNQRNIIYMINTSNFIIENCIVGEGYIGDDATLPISILNSSNGTLKNNIIKGSYNELLSTSHVVIANNIFNSSYQQRHSSFITIRNNVFYPISSKGAGNIILDRGHHNTVSRNSMDGRSDGVRETMLGVDDGIIIADEFNDLIEFNNMSNHFDCGIETINFVSNSTFTHNTIVNQGFCGIGGWWGLAFMNNYIANNFVERSPRLFYFVGYYGGPPGLSYPLPFKNNTFINNVLVDRKIINASAHEAYLEDPANINLSSRYSNSAYRFEAVNNFFQNNNFGNETDDPIITPPALAVDLGGNVCREISGDEDRPLNCNVL